MEFKEVVPFLQANHRGVITTCRRNGGFQTSIVVCGTYEGYGAFVSVHGSSAKVRNMRHNPHCSMLAVSSDWRGYVVVEGETTLKDARNTDGEELRVLLRQLFRSCGDKEHPDWEEYDQAMISQNAVGVLVRPDRVYGLLR